MFSKLVRNDSTPTEPLHKEGDVYKVVTVFGQTFELKYGYYGEKDRQNPLCLPDVVYPDLLKNPVYTEEGAPLVTVMQDACDCYKGDEPRTLDTTCADCKFFRDGEEWFGLCACAEKKQVGEKPGI